MSRIFRTGALISLIFSLTAIVDFALPPVEVETHEVRSSRVYGIGKGIAGSASFQSRRSDYTPRSIARAVSVTFGFGESYVDGIAYWLVQGAFALGPGGAFFLVIAATLSAWDLIVRRIR